MNSHLRSLLVFAACLAPAAAEPLGIEQSLELGMNENGVPILRWYGEPGRTYFIQTSTQAAPLQQWTFKPIIELGAGVIIPHEVVATADKAFFRLKYIDKVPGQDETVDTADYDSDGLENLAEIEAENQTDPLNSDTDGDGMKDGWEVTYNLDPTDPTGVNGADGDPDQDGVLNSEELAKGTNPKDADSDHDGISDGGEIDQQTDPNDPADKPDAEWFVLTGDGDESFVNTRSRSITIPKGQCRLVVVALASEEYPDYTGDESKYNDVLTWSVTGGDSGPAGSLNVNSRHNRWDEAALDGITQFDFPVVLLEEYRSIKAPPDADLVIQIALSATNVGDGTLPSTVMVGVLPVVIAKVSFSGEKYWELTSDRGAPDLGLGGVNYDAPHWLDADGDARADNPDAGDHNFPVAFTSSSTPQIAAKIQIKGLGGLFAAIAPQLKATGPGSIAVPATPLDPEAGAPESWLLPPKPAGTLPATVKYYGAQEPDKEFKLFWSLDLQSQEQENWVTIPVTLHTVYVTFADPCDAAALPPLTKHREETLFNLGRRNANDHANNTDNALVNAIYSEFTDQQVYRVTPSSALREAEVLWYYKDYDRELPKGDLLFTDFRNGACGEWAYLLARVIRAQGIEARAVTIQSKAYANDEGVMVKNWVFVPPGTSGNATYPFTDGLDAVAMESIPAQGHDPNNHDGAQGYNQHIITMSGEYLYDPSYGTPNIAPTNGQADYKKYEESAFDGYCRMGTADKYLGRINNVTPLSPAEVDAILLPIN